MEELIMAPEYSPSTPALPTVTLSDARTHRVIAVNSFGAHTICGRLTTATRVRSDSIAYRDQPWPANCGTCYAGQDVTPGGDPECRCYDRLFEGDHCPYDGQRTGPDLIYPKKGLGRSERLGPAESLGPFSTRKP